MSLDESVISPWWWRNDGNRRNRGGRRAGIHVITTVNVQHLESLYDQVERVTGVRVKERILRDSEGLDVLIIDV